MLNVFSGVSQRNMERGSVSQLGSDFTTTAVVICCSGDGQTKVKLNRRFSFCLQKAQHTCCTLRKVYNVVLCRIVSKEQYLLLEQKTWVFWWEGRGTIIYVSYTMIVSRHEVLYSSNAMLTLKKHVYIYAIYLDHYLHMDEYILMLYW